MNNEDRELTADEQLSSAEAQTDVEANSGTEIQSEEIPEKFQGKSVADVAKSALEAEKAMHETRNEMSSVRRQLQETQQYIQQLQSQMQQQPRQVEADPFEEVAKSWDEDPKEALVKGLRTLDERSQREREKLLLEDRQRQGIQYYNEKKANDQDFAQREQDMVEATRKYGHIVRPEFATSKEAFEVLHMIARGMRVSDYEAKAIERSNKKQESIKDEKRKAVSERAGASSTSMGSDISGLDNFAKMTPAQQKAELDKMASKIGRV